MDNLKNSLVLLQPTGADAKLYGWYVLGGNVVIETVAQYLVRVPIKQRSPNAPVVMQFPKLGYSSLGIYTVSEFKGGVLSNFEGKYYTFIGGIEDIHFKEIRNIQSKDGVISGGQVTWIEGYTYSIESATFTYEQVEQTIEGVNITLGVADATYSRIDLIVLNMLTGVFEVIQGGPSANPLKPQVSFDQYELTEVLVQAGSSSPAGVADVVIYNENIEWTTSALGITVDFNSPTLPARGVKCADVGAIVASNSIVFTSLTPLNVADYSMLSLYIKLKASAATQSNYLYAQFFLGGVAQTELVELKLSPSVLTWQQLAKTMSAWKFTGTTFDSIRFRWRKTGSPFTGFYLDYIKLQFGVSQPEVIETITLSGDVTGSGEVGGTIPTTLKTVNANVGTFGSATKVAKVTVNAKGLVTGVVEETINIPSAQIQSDWNQANAEALDFIKNKPTIPSGGATSYIDLTDTSDTTYVAKDKFVPVVNETTNELDLIETEVLTGATGTFTTVDSKTVTVTDGIITSII